MSDTAKKLFDSIKRGVEIAQDVAPGLKGMGAEATAEMSRMGRHGATELAAALFGGHSAFVLYGPGQQPAKVELEKNTPERGIEM